MKSSETSGIFPTSYCTTNVCEIKEFDSFHESEKLENIPQNSFTRAHVRSLAYYIVYMVSK